MKSMPNLLSKDHYETRIRNARTDACGESGMNKTTNEVERCQDCGRPKAATLHEANNADYCAEADCAAAMRSKNNFLNSITAGAYAIDPKARASVQDVDALAQFIRQIDGNHSMGAGALAERIMEWLKHRADSPAVAEPALVVGRQYRCISAFLANAPVGTILTFSHFEEGEQQLYNFTQEIHGTKVRRVVTKGDLQLLQPSDSPAASAQELEAWIDSHEEEFDNGRGVTYAISSKKLRAFLAGKMLVSAQDDRARKAVGTAIAFIEAWAANNSVDPSTGERMALAFALTDLKAMLVSAGNKEAGDEKNN
jgi:hypothetical protein